MNGFVVRLMVITIMCLACSRGVNRPCLWGTDRHDCAQGLICDVLQDGFEELHGHTYYIRGKCSPPKKLGEKCAFASDCEPKLVCLASSEDQKMFDRERVGPGNPGRCSENTVQ